MGQVAPTCHTSQDTLAVGAAIPLSRGATPVDSVDPALVRGRLSPAPSHTWRVPQLQLSQARATRFSRGSMLRDVCAPATPYRSFLFKSCVHNSYIPSLTRGRAAQVRIAHRGCLPARPTTRTHSLTVLQSHSWKAKGRAWRAHRAQGAGLKVSVFLAAARRRGNAA